MVGWRLLSIVRLEGLRCVIVVIRPRARLHPLRRVHVVTLRRAHVLLPQVLVEGALKRETLPADLTVEGLVVCVAADMVLQLVFSCVLLATEFTDERGDAHVQAHVAVQAAFLIERFPTVDANESLIVRVPLGRTASLSHVILQSNGPQDGLTVLRCCPDLTKDCRLDGHRALAPGPAPSETTKDRARRTGAAEV